VNDLDLDRFVAVCGPDEDVAEIAAFYLTYTSGQLDALHAAIDGRRIAEVEQIAHRCVGSSGTCGMGPIVAPLAELERRARDGNLRDAFVLEGAARTALAHIDVALRDFVARRRRQL